MAHGGGGAGKVYFVLYLAVVLELLIIIVDRDEAEEALHRKQRETMKIVNSILSQLYSGTGSEGISTLPQDEIVFPPPGINVEEVMKTKIQTWRQYIIEVGISDISQGLKRLEGETENEYLKRLFELAERGNVEDLEYQIFYNPSQDEKQAPKFPLQAELKRNNNENFADAGKDSPVPGTGEDGNPSWVFFGYRKLLINKQKTTEGLHVSNISMESFEPYYDIVENTKGADVRAYAPTGFTDSAIFAYSREKTFQTLDRDSSLKKRDFLVNSNHQTKPDGINFDLFPILMLFSVLEKKKTNPFYPTKQLLTLVR